MKTRGAASVRQVWRGAGALARRVAAVGWAAAAGSFGALRIHRERATARLATTWRSGPPGAGVSACAADGGIHVDPSTAWQGHGGTSGDAGGS